MPADDTWPNIGNNLTDAGAPMHLGDPYFPTRAKLVAQADELNGDQAQAIENAYRGVLAVQALVMGGWVPCPFSTITPGAAITFTVNTVTPSLDAFAEFKLIASEDVSAWLTVGMKLRWGVGQYGVVCAVNGANVWVVMPIGSTAPGVSSVLTSVSVSSAASPSGWPTALSSWQYTISSPVDSNGYATGTGQVVDFSSGTVVNGATWKSPSSLWSLHIPGGPFQLSCEAFVEGVRNVSGGINLIGGLSQGGNNEPPGDLQGHDFVGPVITSRKLLRVSDDRDLLNNGAMHVWALSISDGGTTTTCTVLTQSRPVILRARLRYNGG